jgi:hypothetical protein
MKRFIAWCKKETDNGEMYVWGFLVFAGVLMVVFVIFAAIHGSAAL